MGKFRTYLLILTSMFLMSGISLAQEIIELEENLFVSGIDPEVFQYYDAPQESENWCWAACIQMVLNYHGLVVSQEDIVAHIFGDLIDQPGTSDNILTALNNWVPNEEGNYSRVYATTYNITENDLIEDLGDGWPLIVGLRNATGQVGHAYVLTGVFFSADENDEPIMLRVLLNDPWPESEMLQEMPWDEFIGRLMFIARIYVEDE